MSSVAVASHYILSYLLYLSHLFINDTHHIHHVYHRYQITTSIPSTTYITTSLHYYINDTHHIYYVYRSYHITTFIPTTTSITTSPHHYINDIHHHINHKHRHCFSGSCIDLFAMLVLCTSTGCLIIYLCDIVNTQPPIPAL